MWDRLYPKGGQITSLGRNLQPMKRFFLLVLMILATCTPMRTATLPSFEPTKSYIPKISLVGSVDEDTVRQARTALQELARDNAETVVFEINSGGGEVIEGFKLAREIEDYPGRVICVVDGEGMSMAFYILQSCHVRYMTKRSVLMVHRPRMLIHGQLDDIDKANINGSLRALSNGMIEHMAGRMGMSTEALSDKIPSKLAWWMNWEEAVCVNAVDAVVPSVSSVVESLRTLGELPTGLRCNPK